MATSSNSQQCAKAECDLGGEIKLLVLAGGFGTRIQSVIGAVPKALAPIGDVPFLRLQIEHWRSQGINSFTFLLHYRAKLILGFLQKEQEIGVLRDCDVSCLVEHIPMDTGGAVAYAVEQLSLKGNFLVINADTWLGTSIPNVIQEGAPSIAIVEVPNASRYGHVQFDEQHRVTAFQEKSTDSQGSGWINAGLCQLNASMFKDWDHLPFSLERVTLPAMVSRQELKAVALQADFIDIGIPDDYYRFCRWIAADRQGTL